MKEQLDKVMLGFVLGATYNNLWLGGFIRRAILYSLPSNREEAETIVVRWKQSHHLNNNHAAA